LLSGQLHYPNPNSDYCTLPRRLMVMLYDGVAILGILMLATAIALPFGETQKIALQNFWFTMWLLLVCFLYLAGCWRYGSMTLGMRAWRVRIISSDGNRISWGRCLLRFLTSLVSLAAFGLGIFWALVDKKNRSWHDLAGHTLLIKISKN
jgi:uncharacterized RDD family membrane protein YckC